VSPEPPDEVDRTLASGLSALAPDVRDGDETLAALRPRLRRARTRARLVRVGGTVGALVVIGSVATLMAPHAARTRVSVSSQTSTPPSTARTVASSTTTVAGSHGGPTTTVRSTPTTNGTPTTAVTVIVPATTPGGGPPTSNPSTTTTVAARDVHDYSSPSGSISVRFSHGILTLLHVSPGQGFAADVRDRGPDRVEVRFTRDGSETSRIEIRVENGQLVRVAHGDG
jgi:cobalamin biosynthesis Mg chelatase CobN